MQSHPAQSQASLGTAADEQNSDKSSDAAWIVLEAANDLGDHATVEACRRVIDANLNGTVASEAYLHEIYNFYNVFLA